MMSSFPQLANSQDWYNCARDLKNMKQEAEDGRDYAEEAESKKDEMESKKSELEDCRDDPQAYDLYGDGCQSLYYEYQSAKQEYDSVVSNVQSSVSSLSGYMASAEKQCKDSSSWLSICQNLISLKGKYEPAKLYSACKTMMNDAMCKACLGTK